MENRRGVYIDLNALPDDNNLEFEGPGAWTHPEQSQGIGRTDSSSLMVIDVEDFNGDVLPSSWRRFNEARKTCLAKQELIMIPDDDDTEICKETSTNLKVTKRKRSAHRLGESVNTEGDYIDLEALSSKKGKNVPESPKLPQKAPAAVVQAPTFSCPICMDKLKNETSTKCGHIFCENCIKRALTAKKACPTCRKKLRTKDIIRIYLPDSQ